MRSSSSNSNYNNVQNRIQNNGNDFGNKAANLIELNLLCENISSHKIKVQIPEINPISHSIIEAHLNQFAPQWRALWNSFVATQGKNATLQPQAVNYLLELQQLIKETFNQHPIENQIPTFLAAMADKNADLMVRSTGKEDDITAANPGGNTSVAAVHPDPKSVSQAIGVVVASYFSEKSLKQRLLSPPPANDITQTPFMPVLLQRMIGEPVHRLKNEEHLADHHSTMVYSGVMYTNDGRITIQIAPGHGELIVNSKAPFDTFFVSRNKVVYPTIYQKKYRLAPVEEDGERKLVFTQNASSLQNSAAISEEKAREIAELGLEIERHYGMAMDIEFVYNPSEDVTYLVQARPIPVGDRGLFRPSSFSPDQIPLLKKDKDISLAKGAVISPADHAAKIITKKSEILICENIEIALNYYLAQKDSQVKAVIVKNMAPSTSHEAAQFNAKAIPVLQANDIEQISEWIKKPKGVLIIDPQRNQIVDWTNKVKNYNNIEAELYGDHVLAYGRFRSPLPPKVTIGQAVSFSEKVQPAFQSAFSHALQYTKNNILLDEEKPYSQLENLLEVLEAAKAGEHNEDAVSALLALQYYIYRLSLFNHSDPLFQKAVLFCADAKKCLDRYSNLDRSGDAEKVQEEWLDLVSKLSALIVNRGETGLFSDSVYQRAQKMKDRIFSLASLENRPKLSSQQFAYFNEFIKLKKIILNSELKMLWNDFAVACALNPSYTRRLAQLIKFMTDNDIQSDVLNILFPEYINGALNVKEVLARMGKECAETKTQLDVIQLEQIKAVIQGWARRASEWSNPSQFDTLLKEYNKDVYDLIDKLAIGNTTNRLVRKAILKTVQELADMMDITIKAMKGSPEYQTEEHQQLQVMRFAQLLDPYYALMKKWMNEIDAKQYKKWEETVRFRLIRMGKDKVFKHIDKRYQKLKQIHDVNQLNTSGQFSVDGARIGSAASFWFQFVRKKMTLEDMFTLFHQNILASTSFLGKDNQIQQERLPREIQPILQVFNTVENNRKIDLLGIEHRYPVVRLEYNLPLRNHAAKFVFDYDQLTHNVHLKVNFFGNNIGNLMAKTCALAYSECVLMEALGIHVKQMPTYNKTSFNLEFILEFSANESDRIAPLLKSAFLKYGQIPFGKEDSTTLFSYLNLEARFTVLLAGAEKIVEEMEKGKKLETQKLELLSQVVRQLIKMHVRKTPEEDLRTSNLFLKQLPLLMNAVGKNLTTENMNYLNEMINNAISYAQAAANSTSDPGFKVTAQNQIHSILLLDEEIKKRFYIYNDEAKAVYALVKGLAPRHHLRGVYSKNYIDRLNTLVKTGLGAVRLQQDLTQANPLNEGEILQSVLQFTPFDIHKKEPNDIIKVLMEEYLTRPLAKPKNKFKKSDELAKKMIEMVNVEQDHQDILKFANEQYRNNGGNLAGGRQFARILQFLSSVYKPQQQKNVSTEMMLHFTQPSSSSVTVTKTPTVQQQTVQERNQVSEQPIKNSQEKQHGRFYGLRHLSLHRHTKEEKSHVHLRDKLKTALHIRKP